jgi:tryptophan synthase alpha chain
MALETYLKNRLKEKDILLMTHIVLGYPTLDDSFKIIKAMVEAGVDLMELQIPFSEPIADGPVILNANQMALKNGTTVRACLGIVRKAAQTFDIPFLIMSYYNIIFKSGADQFVENMAHQGLKGAIIPDLPPDEGGAYIDAMKQHNLSPIIIFSPTTPLNRMKYLSQFADGFVYCVARKGVTGAGTSFSDELTAYLERCRQATSLPLALGFGVKEKSEIDFLKGKVDIAVIGTQTIRIIDTKGIPAVGDFIRGLR